MTELKIEEVKYFQVNSEILEEFIEQEYGKKYEIVAEEQWYRNSNYSFIVTGYLSDDDKQDVQEWLNGQQELYYPITSKILEDLAVKNRIPIGRYLVRVL